MAVVDSPFFPAMIASTVAGPLPESRHFQDQSSWHHRAVLGDDDGDDAVPHHHAAAPVAPGLSRPLAESPPKNSAAVRPS